MKPFLVKRIHIFCLIVGKFVSSFLLLFFIGVACIIALGWKIDFITFLLIFIGGTIGCTVMGWSEFKIKIHIYGMREFGRLAGSIGRPPEFYKKDGIATDWADEVFILQGWDEGWKEFQSLPERTKATFVEANRRDGYIE